MSGYLDVLEQQIAQRGTSLAVTDEARSLTFAELGQQVAAGADALRRAGVASGDRIALVAENSAAYLVAVLSIWSADAVPVTIYPSTTAVDLSTTLSDADPVLVLGDATTDTLVREAARRGVPCGRIDAELAPTPVATDAKPSPEAVREQLSLICYSSGTTARPKAIMLSATALVNTARTFSEAWRLGPADATLVCLPMAWLFGLTTASFATLFAGGTVVSRRRSRPEILAEAIEGQRVTVIPAVTTVLTKFAAWLDEEDRKVDLSSLRLIISGGEPRNEAAFATLRRFTQLPVHDNYCASEMQPLVTYDPVVDPEPRAGSAGRLVPRSELRIVDADGSDVAPGEVGEGLSRGPGLMLGYWNDPELSADAVTDDGWYRTKDLLRVDEDGYVHVVGRASDMIIRGGSNVSPGEVEARLREHESVIDAAVVGLPDPLYGEEVVAVVRMKEGMVLDTEGLRAFAADGLAAYKIPTRFLAVDHLPSNATTGKVNRKAVKQQVEEGTLA